jgi:hypothetical protein
VKTSSPYSKLHLLVYLCIYLFIHLFVWGGTESTGIGATCCTSVPTLEEDDHEYDDDYDFGVISGTNEWQR